MSKKFTQKDLINLLIKKASGFYYTEEQYEYEKTQKRNDFSKIDNDITKNKQKNDRGEIQISFLNDMVKMKNEEAATYDKNDKNLTLVKKKVATHYISPDMLAIKILLEIYGKEVKDDSIETISDDELIKLKNKLIGELANEFKQSKK